MSNEAIGRLARKQQEKPPERGYSWWASVFPSIIIGWVAYNLVMSCTA